MKIKYKNWQKTIELPTIEFKSTTQPGNSIFSGLLQGLGRSLFGLNTPQLQIQEAYLRSIWYYFGVNLISTNVSRIPIKLFQPGETDKEILSHPVLDALNNPNPLQTGQEFRFAYNAYRLITGNSYIHVESGTVTGDPRQLIIKPSQFVIPELTSDPTKPKRFKFISAEQSKMFDFDEIIHWQTFNPESQIVGLSPVQVAARTLTTNNEAKDWNEQLLKNDARPAGIISVKGDLEKDQRNQLKREVKKFQGAMGGAGRWLVQNADMTWMPLSLSPRDVDWMELMKLSKEEVLSILNIDLQLANSEGNKTYSNFEQAIKKFFMTNVIPTGEDELKTYNNHFFPDGSLELRLDLSQVPAIQENETEKNDRLAKKFWWTINELREADNKKALVGDIYDTAFIPSNWMPADESGNDKEL